MSNFKWNRFVDTFRWDLASQKRFFLRKLLGMFFAFLLLMYIFHFSGEHVGPFYQVVMYMYVIIGISELFKNLNTKQDYVTYLMLPASHLEKYVVRWLSFTVIWIIVGILGFLAADVVSLLLSYALSWNDHVMNISSVWDNISASAPTNGEAWMGWISFAVFTVWLHSVFMLGGTFFRRNASLLTTSVVFVVGVLLIILIFKSAQHIDWDVYELNETVAYWYLIVGGSVFTLLNYYLSYKIFKRYQIITSKWVNV